MQAKLATVPEDVVLPEPNEGMPDLSMPLEGSLLRGFLDAVRRWSEPMSSFGFGGMMLACCLKR